MELSRTQAPAMHAPGGHHSTTVSTAFTYNWSGYADASSTTGEFTAVYGQWLVPKVTCTPEDRLVSDWVGLDGWSNSTVEQDGTLGWCYEGAAHYYTCMRCIPPAAC